MSWIGIDAGAPFERGVYYRIRMTYQPKDSAVISQRQAEYMTKWNGANKHRFDMKSCKREAEFIVIMGYGMAVETLAHLGLVPFWAQHEHIEGIHAYDLAQQLADVGPPPPGSTMPPAIPPGGPTPPGGGLPGQTSMLTVGLVAVGVIGLVIGGVLLLGKKKGSA